MAEIRLVTGSSRGIGLELTRRLLEDGSRVIAAARKPESSAALQRVQKEHGGRCVLCTLDVTSESSVRKMAEGLSTEPRIDVLINNAGILEEWNQPLEKASFESVTRTFETNVMGPLRVIRALLPLLKRSPAPRIVNISSNAGSITLNDGGAYGYRMSKAALNMFTRSLAAEQKEMICVALHPGWVRTDMGGPNAQIDVTESAQGLLNVMRRLTPEHSGRYFDYTGQELPW